jgi:hypothetical protein
LRGIAAVNAQIVAEGRYTTDDGTVVVVGSALEAAVSGTVSHPPDGLVKPPHTATSRGTLFEVTVESSLQAARRLHLAGATRIAVLNFASARNPGGGYLGGAKAQEEDLCRHSLLYPCLLQAPDYYAAHLSSADLLYSHRVIAERVLAVAAHHGARRLVLGAWGCGVFRNDPREVADAFHAHLTAGGAFRPACLQPGPTARPWPPDIPAKNMKIHHVRC